MCVSAALRGGIRSDLGGPTVVGVFLLCLFLLLLLTVGFTDLLCPKHSGAHHFLPFPRREEGETDREGDENIYAFHGGGGRFILHMFRLLWSEMFTCGFYVRCTFTVLLELSAAVPMATTADENHGAPEVYT